MEQWTGVSRIHRRTHTQRAITCHPSTSGGRLEKQQTPAQDFVFQFPLYLAFNIDSTDRFMIYISKNCDPTLIFLVRPRLLN
jgi:hypothetical protein